MSIHMFIGGSMDRKLYSMKNGPKIIKFPKTDRSKVVFIPEDTEFRPEIVEYEIYKLVDIKGIKFYIPYDWKEVKAIEILLKNYFYYKSGV